METQEATSRPLISGGLRGRLLASLLIVLLLPLGVVSYLSLGSLQGIGNTSLAGLDRMGDEAVASSDAALNHLAREKLEAVAKETSNRTSLLLDRIDLDVDRLAGALGTSMCPVPDGARVKGLLNVTFQSGPQYRYLSADGRPDGSWRPLVSSYSVFLPNGSGVAIDGEGFVAGGPGWIFDATSQRYWELAGPAIQAGATRFVYDPFSDNASAGNAYWEPGKTAEDMVVLPHSRLAPFGPILPSNLAALQAASHATQMGPNPVMPQKGNFDSDQLGRLEFVPLRCGALLAGVAVAHVKLAALMSPVREVQEAERAASKSGYAYCFNQLGVLLAHNNVQHVGSDSSWHWWIEWMQPNSTGFLDYVFRGVRRFVAYDEVPGRSMKVVATALASDFLKPAAETGKHIDDITNQTRAAVEAEAQATAASFVIAAILVTAVAVASGGYVGNRVVRPVLRLTSLAERIRKGDFNSEYVVEGDDEVSLLSRAFSNILTTLRMGNSAYYKGDTKKALESFRRGLVLFESSANEKGIATCCNNIGNIYRRWGETDEAIEYYERAIEIGKRLGDEAGLAARHNNMGITMKGLGRLDDALKWYDAALTLDRKNKDRKGEAIRLDNIGIILLERGKFAQAHDHFARSLKIDEELLDPRGLAGSLNNLGLLALARDEKEKARTYLETARDISARIGDVRGEAGALNSLASLYENSGLADEAWKTQTRLTELKTALAPTKDVLIVLDRSGSMDGQKIIAAKDGATNLIYRRVADGDRVGVLAFANDVELFLPLTRKKGNERKIVKAIESIQLRNNTAFYDAVGAALKHLSEERTGDTLWVVALTDGIDNASEKFTCRSLSERGRKPIEEFIEELGLDVTLIVIGVGVEEAAATLKSMCEGSGFGRYIPVEQTEGSGVEDAIREAYGKVEALFGEQENVEEYEPEK